MILLSPWVPHLLTFIILPSKIKKWLELLVGTIPLKIPWGNYYIIWEEEWHSRRFSRKTGLALWFLGKPNRSLVGVSLFFY